MALLDEGETDWKVIVVDVTDPLASKLNDIEDVERHLPGLIRATNEWFRLVLTIISSSRLAVKLTSFLAGSTRFLMANPRTLSLFLVKRKIKSTLLKLSTNVTKHGVV